MSVVRAAITDFRAEPNRRSVLAEHQSAFASLLAAQKIPGINSYSVVGDFQLSDDLGLGIRGTDTVDKIPAPGSSQTASCEHNPFRLKVGDGTGWIHFSFGSEIVWLTFA
jgi:hypothetical protein